MTTQYELNNIVADINNALDVPGSLEYFIEYAYGKPMLFKRLEVGSKKISQGKSGPEMKKYLLAFLDGVRANDNHSHRN